MKPTAIVSFHTNPYTCGVARFNIALSQSLGIPIVKLDSFLESPSSGALLSIKCEELGESYAKRLHDVVASENVKYDLYLHGLENSDIEKLIISAAERVFTATNELANVLRSSRGDVVGTFAPGASPTPQLVKVDCTLLTFGMAHKIRVDGYRKLGEILQRDRRSFRLEISTALHEGTSFSEDFFTVGKEIREVFNGNVSFLGFLADEEVSNRMRAASALVAFFPQGVRENNTTVLSAMSHGCAVITNLDDKSPAWMRHGESVLDVNSLHTFPSDEELRKIGEQARIAVEPYNFLNLGRLLSE